MAVALLTNYLTPYRTPLYERLASDHEVEVLCYAGGERYVPSWFTDRAGGDGRAPYARPFEGGARAAFDLSADPRYDAVIAPYAGGALLPAAYLGARAHRKPFILWASVWAQPWSVKNAAALPVTLDMYRHAAAVVAYGDHVRDFVARIRGRDNDVFVAPQSVEAELFERPVSDVEVLRFRDDHAIPDGPIVLYVGRLVPEKGVGVLLDAWSEIRGSATLVLIGDGPLAERSRATPGAKLLGAFERERLPVAYAACSFSVLASIPTPRFREPWGLVCNEAMHQARPVIATTAVGAAAGGLVRDGVTGVVIPPNDVGALAGAIDRLLRNRGLRAALGSRAHTALAPYTYDAMEAAFARALELALGAGRD